MCHKKKLWLIAFPFLCLDFVHFFFFLFAVDIINSLWCLNYCLESKGFWKICCLCHRFRCLFNISWDLVNRGKKGEWGPTRAVGSERLIGNACAPHCWKLYLNNRKVPPHHLTLRKFLTSSYFAGEYFNWFWSLIEGSDLFLRVKMFHDLMFGFHRSFCKINKEWRLASIRTGLNEEIPTSGTT